MNKTREGVQNILKKTFKKTQTGTDMVNYLNDIGMLIDVAVGEDEDLMRDK